MTVKEINEKIEVLEKESIEREKAHIENVKKLREQKEKLIDGIKTKIKKMFGVLKTEVRFDEYILTVETKDNTIFKYNSNRMEYEQIGLENAMKIKELYDSVYGAPKVMGIILWNNYKN